MASNDHYGGSQLPHGVAAGTPSPAPYGNAHFAPSPQPTPAPSYHSAYPAHQGPYGAPQQPPPRTTASPFDTVFDDHAYPAVSNQRPYAAAAAPPAGSMPQQHGVYPDSGYHGASGPPGSSRPPPAEDIPLRDKVTDKTADFDDHVYDAPQGSRRERRDSGRGKVRLGELGMFGSDRKRIPWVTYIFTLVQVAVFIGELVKNGILTGSPIMVKPQFNPMIGPSTQVMINMGARYTPCMHNIKEIQGSTVPVLFLCPNATQLDQFCPLSEVCGFGGVPNPTFNNASQSPQPNQWYRFIIPIFMHAGLIHIGFNMLVQLTVGKEMEMAIGSIRYVLVYMSAGIFGFVMGGNYAAPGIASTGASGSLFGIIALTLLDLLYSWKERRNPVKDLMFIILDIVIAFVLGLLPGLDNFSHIGGFLMGLGLGVCMLHSPNSLRRRMDDDFPYSAVSSAGTDASPSFLKSPVGFFKGRKPLWWMWWIVRAAALIVVVVVFIVLLNNFYVAGHTCSWCKYLSCLPVSNWCELGTIQQQ